MYLYKISALLSIIIFLANGLVTNCLGSYDFSAERGIIGTGIGATILGEADAFSLSAMSYACFRFWI